MSTYEHENDATLYIAIFENTVLRKLNVKNQSSQYTDAEIILSVLKWYDRMTKSEQVSMQSN
jgi:hypothetical protein